MSSPPAQPISYAKAAVKPPIDTTPEPGKSYVDAIASSPPEDNSPRPSSPGANELIDQAEERRERNRRERRLRRQSDEQREAEDRQQDEDDEQKQLDYEKRLAEREERRKKRREKRAKEKEEMDQQQKVSENVTPSPVSDDEGSERTLSPPSPREQVKGQKNEEQSPEKLPAVPEEEKHEEKRTKEKKPKPARRSSEEKEPSLLTSITPPSEYVPPPKVEYLSNEPRVNWAPLNIPFPRRMQTAAVLWHSLSMSLFFGLFWFTLAIPLTWPILVPYLLYIIFFAASHEDGSSPLQRSNFFRRLPIWRAYASYFPLHLHRTVPLPTTENYIFAYHPHGIISHGAFGNFATEATGFETLFPGITNTLLTLDSNFRIPFYREYLLLLGLASVSRRSCEALLRGTHPRSRLNPLRFFLAAPKPQPASGRAITIVIGGARESLEAKPGYMHLVVRRRRGFLKIAMRENAAVVPVLSFGENDLYEQTMPGQESWVYSMQMCIKRVMGFTLPLAHARGVFNYDVGLMPYRRAVDVVVGRPVKWEGEGEVTEKEVDRFQERYIGELQRLWEENKEAFAADRVQGDEGELKIVE